MILADTSVWIDHLRAANKTLVALLDRGMIRAHPFLIGELALGNLRQRDIALQALTDLPQAGVATDAEILHFIESHGLYGRGIGYIDAHLLAAVHLTAGTELWTLDKRLHGVASRLRVAFEPQQHRDHR